MNKRLRILSLVWVLVATLVTTIDASPAQATVSEPITHTGSGKAINVLNVGDSYGAGNGGGDYYLSSPDDPNAATSGYPGEDCYRSWGNSSYRAYQGLGSKGFYVNRACNGKWTTDVMPEIDNLPADIRNRTDLLTYSAGGNDANFHDIVVSCFTMPSLPATSVNGYGSVSNSCIDLMNSLRELTRVNVPLRYGQIVRQQYDNIARLLNAFPNANLVLSGYPLLVAKSPTSTLTGIWQAMSGTSGPNMAALGSQNWKYGRDILIGVLEDIVGQQYQAVGDLNGQHSNRVAYNDVYAKFGGSSSNNHGVGAGRQSWLVEPPRLPIVAENFHPNPTGWQKMADGIVAAVKAKGWFSAYPVQTKPALQLNYLPFLRGNDGLPLSDNQGRAYLADPAKAAPLSDCSNRIISGNGRIEQGSWLVLAANGLDKIDVTCKNARAGDILYRGSASYLAASEVSSDWSTMEAVQPIPTAWMYNCLIGKTGQRYYQITTSMQEQSDRNPPVPGRPECVPTNWREKVVSAPDGSSHFVDAYGWRHGIRNTETFYALTDKYGAAIVLSQQVDVDTIPRGDDHPLLLRARDYEGKIICRTDGICWVVQSGQRVHIPDRPTEICAKYVHNRPVARTDLSFELANTIPEVSWKYSCNLDNSILRAMDRPDPKPSFTYHGGKIYWIPDSWTWDYFTRRGYPQVNVPTEAEIKLLPYGGTEPARLDPAAIPINSIICRSDGVCWVVDGNRVRHHIPYAQDMVCWRFLRGYAISATNLTADQANALPEADTWPCIIGERIVKSDNGASYWVDTNNVRHWIPDAETFWVLAKSYQVVGPWPAAEVANIPEGARMTYRIDPAGVLNSIICRSDGVCWAVDGGGTRHHIPSYADNVCWRWVNGWRVTRSGLNYEQAASLPEAGAWGCSMNAKIMVTNEGAAYYMWGNTRRWIQDPESYWCYAHQSTGLGYTGDIRGISMSEASGIPETSGMPKCLSHIRVKNRIVRVNDGTAYFVDWSGWWYWIPNGDVWNCLRSRYSVLIWDATWEQVNSIRRERGVWANCSM